MELLAHHLGWRINVVCTPTCDVYRRASPRYAGLGLCRVQDLTTHRLASGCNRTSYTVYYSCVLVRGLRQMLSYYRYHFNVLEYLGRSNTGRFFVDYGPRCARLADRAAALRSR